MRALRWIAVGAVLAIVVIAAAGWWIVATPGGAQLVLNRVAGALGKGAKIEGVEGRLGGTLRVKLIVVDRPDFYVRIDDVEMDTEPLAPLRGQLLIHKLSVRSVELRTAGAAGAAKAPVAFTPPYPFRLEDGRIGTFRHGPLSRQGDDLVLHDIVLKGEGDRKGWRIEEGVVVAPQGTVKVAGTLQNASPFALDLDGRFEGRLQDYPVRVNARAKGTLGDIEARLDGTIANARAEALAVVRPFDTTPLKSLSVDARDVDLARIAEGLPATRLVVSARLAPQGNDFAGPVHVTNGEPGPWDAG
jgi:translocation and assembly module TamB